MARKAARAPPLSLSLFSEDQANVHGNQPAPEHQAKKLEADKHLSDDRFHIVNRGIVHHVYYGSPDDLHIPCVGSRFRWGPIAPRRKGDERERERIYG
jgi:hypothetical protein